MEILFYSTFRGFKSMGFGMERPALESWLGSLGAL